MPYLSLPIEKHDKNCTDPFNVKRLWIKDYDDKGRQKFVRYALTCLSCNVILRDVNFEHTPTNYQKHSLTTKMREKYTKEELERAKKYDLIRKVKRRKAKLERKLLGEERISPEENGLRRRIRGFNNLYSGYGCSDKVKKLINWDMDLCQRFLDVRPLVKELRQVIHSSPWHVNSISVLTFNNRAEALRRRHYIPDLKRPGWFEYDKSPWIPDPDRPGRSKWNNDKNFLSEYDKLIINEAEIRKKLMNDMIKRNSHDRQRELDHDNKEAERLEAKYLRQQT